MPSNHPRPDYMMKATISYEIPQPAHKDPDLLKPAITDRNQTEVTVKPVPRPRSKLQPRVQSNTDNTTDSGDTNNNKTNGGSQHHPPLVSPRPVCPPPRPPKYLSPCNSTGAANRGSQYMNSSTEPTVKPPSVRPEIIQNPPRPQRPPPPSTYHYRSQSIMGTQSKNCTEVSQQSTINFIQQTPDSSPSSEEELILFGTYGETSADNTDKPAVPARLSQSYLQSASDCVTSLPQNRPPPPPFNPPPPPSTQMPSESLYSEIENHPYLDVLPEDENMKPEKIIPRSGLRFQSHCFSLCQKSQNDNDDLYAMLRWLTRVSKSDYINPSPYGLSIEEEIRAFNQRAMNVSKALRLYNVLMMKRNESLRNIITEFSSISNSLDKLLKKTKTMSIAGGTTGAVGGVTAVVGIALAPVTMGASLIATAVGAGMVASAGGMGAHTVKSNKKIVNKMTIEKLVYDYKSNVVDLEHCLDYILSGLNELRRHDIARLQRAGAQTDALRMAHLSQSVFRNNMNNKNRTSSHTGGMSSERLLLAFAKELDQYFPEKADQKLKKSSKGRFSGRLRLLAENLQEELEHLNRMWEMFS